MIDYEIEWEIESEFDTFKEKLFNMFPDLESWQIRDILEPLVRMM